MENKEMFEIMLNKIEELTKENTSLKLRIKFYQKCDKLKQQEDKGIDIDSERELDEIFDPENYRFNKLNKSKLSHRETIEKYRK